MSGVGLLMEIGRKGLVTSQTALNTTSHNISNVNTKGYSKQRVEQQADLPVPYQNHLLGSGVVASRITRASNEYVDRQLRNENTALGEWTQESELLSNVEAIFNESNAQGVNKLLSNLFNSLRELSVTPYDNPIRVNVRETAKALVGQINRLDTLLTDVQANIDQRIETRVGIVNNCSKEVAALNAQITENEHMGLNANDQRDRRDVLLKDISKLIETQVVEDKSSGANVIAGRFGSIVSGYNALELSVQRTPVEGRKGAGLYDIFLNNGNSSTQVTGAIWSGEIGDLIYLRDEYVPQLRHELDKFAYYLSKSFNEVHKTGYGIDGQAGRNFFNPQDEITGSAGRLKVSDEVLADTRAIASGYDPNGISDNRMLLALTKLEYIKTVDEGRASLDETYNALVGRIAMDVNNAKAQQQNHASVCEQLEAFRESFSGVSLDEEAMDMLKFQRAYQASAKAIKTADEVMQTVLDLKR